MRIPFDNSYAQLPPQMYTAQLPTPVKSPQVIATNADLAAILGIDPEDLATPDAAQVFAGNNIPDGAAPLAQVYAGHQFGNWNPQLGDGRAVLLGEVDWHRRSSAAISSSKGLDQPPIRAVATGARGWGQSCANIWSRRRCTQWACPQRVLWPP